MSDAHMPEPDRTERIVVRSFAIGDGQEAALECSLCGPVGTVASNEDRRAAAGKHLIDVHKVAVLLQPED